MRHDVLVYHYHLATSHFKRFSRFINNPDYSFAIVDTINDLKSLDVLGLTCRNHFNIGDHYKVWGRTNNKQNSLVDLAWAIHMKMKDESKKEKNA
ncbi:Serine/threonine-protein kinase [Hordeum vulgare]|nr:Serine/threonine-protein kinase [Hordeum vulgare]